MKILALILFALFNELSGIVIGMELCELIEKSTECTETDIVADVIDDLVSKFGTDRIEERIKYIKENGMRAGE